MRSEQRLFSVSEAVLNPLDILSDSAILIGNQRRHYKILDVVVDDTCLYRVPEIVVTPAKMHQCIDMVRNTIRDLPIIVENLLP